MSEDRIVIDLQNGFFPVGASAVPGADQVVKPINALIGTAGTVILSQDWNPKGVVLQ